MNQFDLLKSHIDAYTRKDGAVVAAHDDKRTKKPIAIGVKVKLKGDQWGALNGYKGTVSGKGRHDGQFNVRGADGQDRAFSHKDLEHDESQAGAAPADGDVGHEEHKKYGAYFKKGDKVKDNYGKSHEVLSHRGPEVHTTGGSYHPTKLHRV